MVVPIKQTYTYFFLIRNFFGTKFNMKICHKFLNRSEILINTNSKTGITALQALKEN
jgi:hypothetical protein